MNNAQVESKLKHRLKYIKKTLKEKIASYKPLDYKTAYNRFMQWIQDDCINNIEKIPERCKAKWCMELLIKNFLIREAYYVLGEKYIQQCLMNRLGLFEENDIKILEILDYIMEKLEKNSMEKLKKFKEKCQFKTFLSLVAVSELLNFWRKKYRAEKKATKYETDFEDEYLRPVDNPVDVMINAEDEELKSQIGEILPGVLAELDTEEKLVYQLKYEMDLKKTSEIARRLGRSHYKTRQLIQHTEEKIKREILARIKRGGNHETHRN
ncbi:MAG: sigma-70 family RNA polymerase sigma factor [Candidatus Aminicenantes bacterium]|jgi:RNA polymerase sigma factor (sigma-70 family)